VVALVKVAEAGGDCGTRLTGVAGLAGAVVTADAWP
jgi:hypothetical protein